MEFKSVFISKTPTFFSAIAFCCVFFTLALLSTGATYAQSCTGLSNGSFESGSTDWTIGSGTSYGSSTSYVMDGSKSIWIYKGRFATIASIYQDASANPNYVYELEFYSGTHKPNYSHQVSLEFYDKNDQLLSATPQEVDHNVSPSNLLQRYSLSATAPANTDYLRVKGTASGDYLKLDGICLTETPTGSFPVEWLDFSVQFTANRAQLEWATASELNSSHFDVQRSWDGIVYENLGQVAAAGNSQTVQTYQFTDQEELSIGVSTYYYRIRQVDLDGTSDFSNVIELSPTDQSTLVLKAYPNPVQDYLTVNWESNDPTKSLRVESLNGQVLYHQELGISSTAGQLTLPVSAWSPGVYVLELIGELHRSSHKIIKY